MVTTCYRCYPPSESGAGHVERIAQVWAGDAPRLSRHGPQGGGRPPANGRKSLQVLRWIVRRERNGWRCRDPREGDVHRLRAHLRVRTAGAGQLRREVHRSAHEPGRPRADGRVDRELHRRVVDPHAPPQLGQPQEPIPRTPRVARECEAGRVLIGRGPLAFCVACYFAAASVPPCGASFTSALLRSSISTVTSGSTTSRSGWNAA